MAPEWIAYRGSQRTIEYAVLPDGSMPARDFFYGLSARDQARVLALFKRYGDEGRIANKEQFKKIENTEFFEFKRFQIRIPCFFLPGGRVVLTHGFMKKKDKLDPREITVARGIRERCHNVKGD